MRDRDVIGCGMYAFTPGLRGAWAALFAGFELDGDGAARRVEVRFEGIEKLEQEPRLLLAHGCGYPLVTRLYTRFEPACVGEFAIDGAGDGDYRARLVVAADSPVRSLAECRGGRAAINGADSNSGMNLLRDALARAGARPGFLAATLTTGAHLASAEAVAAGRATLAAIDCVTWRYIEDEFASLAARLRVIGDTGPTRGLPWLMPRAVAETIGAARITRALNDALAAASPAAVERLRLRGFRRVALADYRPISAIEDAAIAAGYPEIG